MSIENAIINIMENNLDAMRANFSVALSEKAVQKLDERKRQIAENYFGQVDELRNFKNEKDVLDYVATARKQIGDIDPYDLSPEGDRKEKTGRKRISGMKLLVKKAEKAKKKG